MTYLLSEALVTLKAEVCGAHLRKVFYIYFTTIFDELCMSFSILCCPLHSSLVVARLGVETLEGESKINLVKTFEKMFKITSFNCSLH